MPALRKGVSAGGILSLGAEVEGVITMEVEVFNSLEEASKLIQQERKAADAKVKPWQARIKRGDCFATMVQGELVIFGEVLERYQKPEMKHCRFCRCYSVACPQGELGDVHVSTIWWVISRDMFERARACGWDVLSDFQPP